MDLITFKPASIQLQVGGSLLSHCAVFISVDMSKWFMHMGETASSVYGTTIAIAVGIAQRTIQIHMV